MATITARKNKDGIITSYTIRVLLYEDSKGKHYETSSFKINPEWKEKTARKKAEAYAATFERDIKNGVLSNERRRFDDYAEYVIELKQSTGKCKTTTLDRYRQMRQQVYPAIGYIRLKDLRPEHLNRFYMDLKTGKFTGNPLSAKSIRNYHGFISTVLEQAFKEGAVVMNVAHRAEPPKVEQKEPETLEVEQLQTIFKVLESEPMKWRAAIMLLAETGMRRGELFGLKWDKVNLNTGTIEICNNLLRSRETHTLYEDTPKTKMSNRTICITSEMTDFLKQYKAWQNEERLRLGGYFVDKGFLFAQDNGNPMQPDSLTNYCCVHLQNLCGFHISPHLFRHTQASLLIANKVPITSVSKRLGHSQTSTTMNIYAHALKNADEENVKVLQTLLYGQN